MDSKTLTLRDTPVDGSEEREPVPGLLLVFAGERPAWSVLPVAADGLEIGRGALGVEDVKVSRKHARVELAGQKLTVRDLGSTNGTFVNGVAVQGATPVPYGGVLRLGSSVFVPVLDTTPFLHYATHLVAGTVVGATLARVHHAIGQAAQLGENLLLHGASGSGKEVAARIFHVNGPAPNGPYVAVNCATIPPGLAERLLFGAKKGAYSGADGDSEGYLQAADGGTLFLDEVAELELVVQAKLLRVLESKEVTPLGATRSKKVDVRVCCATHADLRARVGAKSFRQDLYFRVARPEVRIPPLAQRPEEIALHIAEELARVAESGQHVMPDATLVEACILRPWPGNVRELYAEVRRAALAALRAHRSSVLGTDLDDRAGQALPDAEPEARDEKDGRDARGAEPEVPDDEIASALREEKGNVSRAAARLGIHRNRVRRWLERHGIDRHHFDG